ncbi:MAG TPA: hypothetical protein VKW78_02260 [Terriglobales bacterium]|nr:hypothetical protein [Terriglobales bacterium]
MKRTITTVTAAFALVVTLGLATAYAQSEANLRADVPFNFTVAKGTLPAGECRVAVITNVARVICGDEQSAIVGAPAQIEPGTPKLVFHKYGDRYFLSEVWTSSKRLTLATSGAEKEMMANAGDRGFDTLAVLLHTLP